MSTLDNMNDNKNNSNNSDNEKTNDNAVDINNEKLVEKVISEQKQKVHSTKNFVCESIGCGYKTKYKQNLNRHKIKHNEKSFKCDIDGCGFSTAYKQSIDIHNMQHKGQTLFECDHKDCKFKTMYESSRINHIRNIHSTKKRLIYKRKDDKKIVNTCIVRKVRSPYRSKQEPIKRDLSGGECSSLNSGYMIKHSRTPTGEKQYKCKWIGCEHTCSSKSELNLHNRTHTGEKSLMCDKFSALNTSNTTEHTNTHTGEKPFEQPLDLSLRKNV